VVDRLVEEAKETLAGETDADGLLGVEMLEYGQDELGGEGLEAGRQSGSVGYACVGADVLEAAARRGQFASDGISGDVVVTYGPLRPFADYPSGHGVI
jgi:hypothetical protein